MPKIVDHDQYRQELLRKCFDLFAQKGYGALTMRQISESLNVSTGTLYHYFPSKQALFEQLVEEINQQDISSALAEIKGTQTISEIMTAIGKYLVKNEDYFINQTYIWVDFCQHQNKETIANIPVFQRVNQRCQQAVCDFLGIQDPVLASFILSFINGLILEKLWGNQTINFPEQCALLGKMITSYLSENP
ncbi:MULTISPECIES: TetR/AcrR family transcriptional regulator [unclassified Nodularia (in: cyanobacteria)]|uniref:TetR/AcrR family transcriptional regulator n=1 Tax=unclassified Nodularia (in: cyanobacteria) TaxID=2656917 RepID=UPI001882F3FA|nr:MULTISPECIES: TetR/AcrR family transcriptional regulator [unclassified Nodularia (in: cyanobacteria)]MBE9201821.1 TetR/AcrR family transcriptional regulator [Nodularia sp. LEGE 06071]MCC2693270.1 TetR/AcrR family transcriptional regulator [Nodularia sp. LEGE 04288]